MTGPHEQKPRPLPETSGDLDVPNPDVARQREIALSRSEHALRVVCANLPWLSVLAAKVSLVVDDRVSVAAVTATGRVLVNPNVFAAVPLREAVFVLAHELLHLALDTFSRESKFDDHETVNRAHDYIINDILRQELRMSPPLNGLDLLGASEKSLEKIVAWMNENRDKTPIACWKWTAVASRSGAGYPGGGSLSRALRDAGVLEAPEVRPTDPEIRRAWDLENLDVISEDRERELFPEDESRRAVRLGAVHREAVRALSLHEVSLGTERLISRGTTTGDSQNFVSALRGSYSTPWEVALQRWMEAVAPGQRTWSRPSRRGADRSDCVRPGRSREGWTLHLVLDTSGSMAGDLPSVLGAIAQFGETSGVVDVHILQCDVSVTADEWVPVEVLDSYRIAGYGGSDMSPAMQQLAADPEVSAMVVITDGCISYPNEVPPCRVLWVLTGDDSFEPPYGEVLKLNANCPPAPCEPQAGCLH